MSSSNGLIYLNIKLKKFAFYLFEIVAVFQMQLDIIARLPSDLGGLPSNILSRDKVYKLRNSEDHSSFNIHAYTMMIKTNKQ